LISVFRALIGEREHSARSVRHFAGRTTHSAKDRLDAFIRGKPRAGVRGRIPRTAGNMPALHDTIRKKVVAVELAL